MKDLLDIIEIEFYPEDCCELCNEVIHNHFDCPACLESYAGTDAYGEIDGDYYKEIQCQSCSATFKLIEKIERNTWKCLKN